MTDRYDQSRQSWDAGREHWQAILNARPIPARRSQIDYDAPVRARIVWERDGEEWIETRAVAYTHDAVLVLIHDKRLAQRVAEWIPPEDVRRRPVDDGR